MICIIDCGTSWLQEIIDHVSDFGFEYKVFHFEKLADCDFEKYSGIIISGAPIILVEQDLNYYKKIFSFIKTVEIPILGICLGHQIMGILYGAKITKDKMIDKYEQIEILKENKLFQDIPNNLDFRQEHSEFVTIPEKFTHLAKSDSCHNEAMQFENKFGVQFHPEVSGKNGAQLIKNFLTLCR